jgi:uncharacterized membrane protein
VSTPTLDALGLTAGPIAPRPLAFREEHGGFSLTLKRNCSISPSGLACVFAALAGVVLAIGLGFAIVGAWLILPFAGLGVVLLGGAFLLQARHATDYERIALERGRLKVEVAEGRQRARYELDARRVRVDVDGTRVMVRDAHEALEVGRHLDEESRRVFGDELKKRLRY